MPPDVGIAETSSDIHSPMIRMKAETSGQPHAIAAGPPLFQPRPNEVKQPDRIEMMENEIAKLLNPDQERCSSCVYPSSARSFSSAFSTSWPSGTVILLLAGRSGVSSLLKENRMSMVWCPTFEHESLVVTGGKALASKRQWLDHRHYPS